MKRDYDVIVVGAGPAGTTLAYELAKKGIGVVFKSIAIQEGDFDAKDGRAKTDILRDYFGEKMTEWYKETFPEKYEYLRKLDEEK